MIRQAIPADIEAFERLTERAYAGYLDLLGRRPTPMDRDYRPLIAAGSVWVEQDLKGGIVLEASGSKLEVYSLVVDPRFSGSGIGRSLLSFAELRAASTGIKTLRLCTSDKMHRNLSIYRAFGFQEIERLEIAVSASPIVVWLEKNVRDAE